MQAARLSSGLVATALLLAIAAVASAGPTATPFKGRCCFEVTVHAEGELAADYSWPNDFDDHISFHEVNWYWTGHALMAYGESGPQKEPELKNVSVKPRVSANWQDRDGHTQSGTEECRRIYSTAPNIAKVASYNLATTFHLDFDFRSADPGAPIDRKFSVCGGVTSYHARNDTYKAMDGLAGPWHFVVLKYPSRAQLRTGTFFSVVGYKKVLNVNHGNPPHRAYGYSTVVMTFRYFPPASVPKEVPAFNKRYPLNSGGFKPVA